MKDENIKEILDFARSTEELDLSGKTCILLLDYITNLQEENKMYAQLKDEYEDIINKAIDKLYCYGEVFDSKILQQFQKEMENILNGGDDNE